MISIRDVVQEALNRSYLTLEAENLLRQLLSAKTYSLEDLKAFTMLQRAAMSGQVQQESYLLITSQPPKT